MKISKQRKTVRIVFWALAVATMVAIALFSAQNGESSSETSSGVTVMILRIFHPDFDLLSAAEQAELIESIHLLIRKLAHFSAYAFLGFNCACASLTYFWRNGRRFAVSFAIGAAYAVSDEIHQLFVPQRAGTITDVLIDSCGVVAGVLLSLFIIARIFKKHIRSNEE